MSIKIKQALSECLTKIENKEFDEETIRTLLIVSREYLQFDGLIKELAHFIAHPNRNKGLFHKKVNSRYAKLKLVDEQLLINDISKRKITNEKELSDFMLGGIGLDKIDAELFEILYYDGLEDISENDLIKYTGLNKKQAEKILKNSYTKDKNFYFLNVIKTEKMISLLQKLPKKVNEEEKQNELNESIQNGLNLIRKTRESIDNLQKVIRGTVQFRSVFDSSSLSKDFKENFKKILNQFDIAPKFTKVLEENIQGILVCLMTLLHDSKFEFFDKNTARVYLSTYYPENSNHKNENITSKKELIYELGVLALYTNYKFLDKSNFYPLFVSNIKLKDYIDKEDFMNTDIDIFVSEIPWISSKRHNTKLRLETYS